MHKPKVFFDELFMVNYFVSYGITSKEFISSVKRNTSVDISNENIGDASTIPFKSELIWIWTKDKDISVLAHEIFHATRTALSMRDVLLCEQTEEIYAYYIGYLTKMIIK